MRTTGTFRRLRNRVHRAREEIAAPVAATDPRPYPDAAEVVARNIRQLMDRSKSLNDTKALAEKSGVSEAMLGNLLQQQDGALCVSTLDRIAAAFGVPAWTLIHRDWDRKRREAQLLDGFLREMRK